MRGYISGAHPRPVSQRELSFDLFLLGRCLRFYRRCCETERGEGEKIAAEKIDEIEKEEEDDQERAGKFTEREGNE